MSDSFFNELQNIKLLDKQIKQEIDKKIDAIRRNESVSKVRIN